MADVKLYLSDLRDRRQRIRRRLRVVGLVLAAVAIVLFIWWLLFRSPMFHIREVRVLGNRRVVSNDLISTIQEIGLRSSRVARWFSMSNILSWPRSVPLDMSSTLSRVKELSITKHYFERTIDVAIREREPYAIWCLRKSAAPECYWLEEDGTIFESAPEAEGNLVPVVNDYATDNLSLGDRLLGGEFVSNLRTIFDVLGHSRLAVREIRYEDPSLHELKVVTYNGPVIYFSLRFSSENAHAVIESLIDKDAVGKLTPRFKDLQYIDFRVENRAYYK